MLSIVEKAKLLKEFRELRLALSGESLGIVDKARKLKRFREIRLLLGGQNDTQPSVQPLEAALQRIKESLPTRFKEGEDARMSYIHFYHQDGVLKCRVTLTYKYYTPVGFLDEEKSKINSFILRLNDFLEKFCIENNFDLAQKLSFADIKKAAEHVEKYLDMNGEELYQKSTSELSFPILELKPKTTEQSSNPIYQRVIDGEEITRELLVELNDASLKDPDPFNAQLVQASQITLKFMRDLVMQPQNQEVK